ncbi:MAG: S8 family serine peptidase [Bacilli bacterium]
MRQSIKLIFILNLFFILALGAIYPNPSSKNYEINSSNNLHLLMEIDENEANEIAKTYNLDFLDYSNYGYATFVAQDDEQYKSLLNDTDLSFIPNNLSITDARPPINQEDLTKLYALSLIDTYDAWQLTMGSSSVLVAIIDTGIDIYHSEFTGKISSLSYNSKTKTVGLTQVIDDQGHGTMVAGVIAATKGNNIGIAGVAPSSSLLVIKANEPNEGSFLDSSVIEGIYYAADHGADVINMSLGSPYANPLTKTALEYARSKGALIVAAAGNDSVSTPYYPASFDTTISVSAVDQTQLLATYSNFGSNISVAAPGTNIYTTVKGNTYGYGSGTSLAAPQVSGVLALMLAYLNMSDEEILSRILLTATDLGNLGKDDSYGYGLVNSYDALVHPLVTVSFETFGGTVLEPIQVAANRPFICTQIPEKELSIFEGWYKDSLLMTPWVMGTSVTSTNITLYAKYTKSSYLVSFVTSGSYVEDMIVAANGSFTLPTTSLDQYQFIGWFLDSQYLEPYVSGPVTADLTLYAKFEKLDTYYNIFFVTQGSAIDPIQVKEGESVSPPPSLLTGYTFHGWYLDSNYSIPYQNEPVTSSMTLYALFDINDYDISYFIDNELYDTITLPYNSEIPNLEPAKEGYTFSGWYLDDSFTTPLDDGGLENNLSLFGFFTIQTFEVIYLVDDTIISQQTVNYGENATPPSSYTKPDSISFFYEFIGWSEEALNVTSNLTIIAIFNKTFKPTSIALQPGIDTIYQNEEWIDAGLIISNSNITYTTQSQVDTHFIGRYLVLYFIYEEANLVYEKTRVVSVIEKPPVVQITLNDDVTTIFEGNEYLDAGANTNVGTITTKGTVDYNQEGTYVIVYEVVVQNITYQKHKYVYVVKEVEPTSTVAFIVNDKKRWYEV